MSIDLTVADNNNVPLSVEDESGVDVRAGDTINIGVSDYEALDNKPQIEGVELVGNKALDDLNAYTQDEVDTLLSGKADASDIPTKVSELENDRGYLDAEIDPTVPAWAKTPSKPTYTASEVGALSASTVIPSKTSQLTNDSGFLTSETDPTVPSWAKQASKPSYTAQEVGALPDSTIIPTVPTNVSAFSNDAGYITTETDPTVSAWAKASTKPSYTAAEVGAVPTSRKVNNKALTTDITLTASDVSALPDSTSIPSKTSDLNNDSGFITGMTILSYGSSTWNDFLTAYNANKVVYCRASSNANPGTGTQGRMAFMAFINFSGTTPTSVEFQYYRSVSSHSDSQQGDQVFIYKLENNNTWSVTTREAYTKITNGTGIGKSYSSGTLTLSLNASIPTKVSDLTNDSGFITTETDPTVPSWAKASSKPSYTASEVGALADTTKYADAKVAGGAATNTQAIPYGVVDGTSTSTAFTATVPGITEYKDGTCVMLRNGVVTSAAGFTININGLGAKPVYQNMAAATADTTIFNINYTMLFVYDEDRVEGGSWTCYRGYNSDNNTIGYQLRTNSTAMPTVTRTRYYRLLFTSADDAHWVPANTGYDNSATSKKTVNQNAIDPFGRIVYMTGTTNVNANANVGATVIWDRYTLNLGYSFNTTGQTLVLTYPAPVYVKCAPQSNGSAIIDSTTPYVQALPSTEDGKIYIYLGMAYSATNIELVDEHPVYYYKDSAIRLWSNTPPAHSVPSGGTSGQVLTKASGTDYDLSWTTPSGGGGGVTSNTISVQVEQVSEISFSGGEFGWYRLWPNDMSFVPSGKVLVCIDVYSSGTNLGHNSPAMLDAQQGCITVVEAFGVEMGFDTLSDGGADPIDITCYFI